jgi:hypothetical protein
MFSYTRTAASVQAHFMSHRKKVFGEDLGSDLEQARRKSVEDSGNRFAGNPRWQRDWPVTEIFDELFGVPADC